MQQDLEMQRKLAALTALALNYGKDFPKPLVKTWMRLLEPYSATQVEAGVDKVMVEYEYKTLPPFAVLAKALKSLTGQIAPEEAMETAALAEWERMLSAAERLGRYNKPEFDQTTEQVIRLMGGWDAVCDWETSKLEWKCKEFMAHWQNCAKHADTMPLPARDILALSDGNNRHQFDNDTIFALTNHALGRAS